MKQAQFHTILAATVLLFTVSCSNEKGSADLMIPKQAAFVVHIKSSSLTSKLTWNDIKASNWFKKAAAGVTDSLNQELMKDPEASGINTKADMTFFMSQQGRGGITVFEGSVKDAEDFETYNKKRLQDEGKTAEIEKDGDIRFLQSEESSLIGWTDSKFIYISDAPMSSQAAYGFEGDENYGTVSFGKDSLKKFVKNLFNLSGSSNLANDDRFKNMLKEEGDIHLWTNMSENPAMKNAPGLNFMALGKLFEDSYSASTISFDEGKITWKTKNYFSKELSKIAEKYSDRKVTEELVNRIPSQNVVVALVANYPSEYTYEFIKAAGFDGAVNAYLGKYNYSLDELVKAHKGETVLTVSDIGMKSVQKTIEGTTQTYPSSEPTANFLLALSVKDKSSFDKMVSLAETTMKEHGGLPKELSYRANNEWFVASNANEQVENFLAGSKNKFAFASKISGHPFGMYIDIQKALTSAKNFVPGQFNGLDIAMKTWQDIIFTGGEYKDGYMVSTMEINFVDKKTNSLKQINNFIDQMAAGGTGSHAYESQGGDVPPTQEGIKTEEVTTED